MRRGRLLLVGEGYDPVTQKRFYRPLGGEVEPGETAREAAVREMLEEVGERVEITRHLGTLDNRFVYAGRPGWEIVDVFEGVFVDPVGDLISTEEGWRVIWVDLDALDAALYPEGIRELLVSA